MHITSNAFKHDGKTGKTVYTGDVKLNQGSIKLEANRIEMQTSKGGDLISLIAQGNTAYFEQQPKPDKEKISGRANTITYTAKTNTVTLKGNARIKQGEQMMMESDFIEYLADSDQVRANPTTNKSTDKPSRVNIVIPPRAKQPTPQQATSKQPTPQH